MHLPKKGRRGSGECINAFVKMCVHAAKACNPFGKGGQMRRVLENKSYVQSCRNSCHTIALFQSQLHSMLVCARAEVINAMEGLKSYVPFIVTTWRETFFASPTAHPEIAVLFDLNLFELVF